MRGIGRMFLMLAKLARIGAVFALIGIFAYANGPHKELMSLFVMATILLLIAAIGWERTGQRLAGRHKPLTLPPRKTAPPPGAARASNAVTAQIAVSEPFGPTGTFDGVLAAAERLPDHLQLLMGGAEGRLKLAEAVYGAALAAGSSGPAGGSIPLPGTPAHGRSRWPAFALLVSAIALVVAIGLPANHLPAVKAVLEQVIERLGISPEPPPVPLNPHANPSVG